MLHLPKKREIIRVGAEFVVPKPVFAMLALPSLLMAGASDYLEDGWLKTLRGNSLGTSFTAPAHVYVKLHVGDPGDSSPSNTNAYGTTGIDRTLMEIAFGAPTGTTQIAMSGAFTPTWTSLLTGSTSISHISLWDSSTLSSQVPTGNCLCLGPLTSSVPVSVGDTFILSSCTITVD